MSKDRLTLHNDGQKHQWHNAALRIVHEHPISQPGFCLFTNLTIFTVVISLWNQPTPIIIGKVFDDRRRLCKYDGLGRTWCEEFNHWGLAQRMDLFQFRRSKRLLGPSVGLEFIWDSQLFQEPENSMGSRCLKPGLCQRRDTACYCGG